MEIEEWWSKLTPTTREWLIENNGDAVPAEILEEITRAAGAAAGDAWWVGERSDGEPTGFTLSDEAIDWIETTANDETAERP